MNVAGVLFGVGLGGFVDGILLHQILHWHNMLSARIPLTDFAAVQTNMRADGWFHAAVWLVTFAAAALLWTTPTTVAHGRPFVQLIGLFFLGWGGFNLVEGLIDHHLLELHHVRDIPAHVPLYDYLFLGLGGVGFMLLGWRLIRSVTRLEAPAG